MILQVLYRYAEEEGLAASMELKPRVVHLVLNLRDDGSVSEAASWTVLTHEVENPKTKTAKTELGRKMPLPEFPGVNSGGKANFLADSCDKVFGINGKTGEPISDDSSKGGGNALKAFQHFWQRITEAHAANHLPELAILLEFKKRYLDNESARGSWPFVGFVPLGKDGKPTLCALGTPPVPLEKATITFGVGAGGSPIFQEGSPLHDYWKETFRRERFSNEGETEEAKPEAPTSSNRGLCLVTGGENEPIAEVHRTLIKGIPGLPPIGGYLVSFDLSSPALTSFGFKGGWNAPVSEAAAAGYALALNHILADEHCRRKFGGAVLASWIDGEHDLTSEFNRTILEPPISKGDVQEFFRAFESEGKYHSTLTTKRFRSVTFAANGGRVVVRRWLDEPLRDAVDALRLWFEHLEVDHIEVPRKEAEKSSSNAPPPLSIYALAATTARISSEVADGVYDSLYRAALEGDFNPRSLLPPILQRLRIAATQSGNGIRFKTSHFALIKLILIRSKESPMELTPHLSETNDPAYNCGRLLAVLDDLQRAAQGQVGAGIIARFYGSASTCPLNVFPYLLKHSKHHETKLLKDPARQAAGFVLRSRIQKILGLFQESASCQPPDFPGLLNPQEQGRFALGFHQQKGKDELDRKAASEAKKLAKESREAAASNPDLEEAIAIAEAINAGLSAGNSG